MKKTIFFLSFFFCFSVNLGASPVVSKRTKVFKKIANIASVYNKDLRADKTINLFGLSRKDQKFFKNYIEKHNIKRLPKVELVGEKIKIFGEKQLYLFEVVDLHRSQYKLNGYEYKHNYRQSWPENMAYLQRVMRKVSDVSLWEWMMPRAYASSSDDMASALTLGLFQYNINKLNSSGQLINFVSDLNEGKKSINKIRIKCEPEKYELLISSNHMKENQKYEHRVIIDKKLPPQKEMRENEYSALYKGVKNIFAASNPAKPTYLITYQTYDINEGDRLSRYFVASPEEKDELSASEIKPILAKGETQGKYNLCPKGKKCRSVASPSEENMSSLGFAYERMGVAHGRKSFSHLARLAYECCAKENRLECESEVNGEPMFSLPASGASGSVR